MDFITNTNNLLLLATLLTSGVALALPQILGRLNKQLLSVHTAIQWVNQRNAQIVDIRTDQEYKTGHIANSKHLPLAELDGGIPKLRLDARKPVILVCLSGSRANTAARKFKKAGFDEVACMEGGVSAWNQAGLPLVK
ncbi:rhodanese-like domain-containing protein [Polynucleobacter sp. 30F-ANTBAC]|jgi:rhodanese-related sulfurtransferase|uniref:rhodanese-like domain-containing protein n=1 Tax=Polynucleobacter sp. 30F-ANTBAC TaxID=2689095 RepID=UPI001C0E7ABD|nr:rhodanese-like domain-containing protein [Polynucleobacter sp. 30F-ANTBAC]MBU3600160.1 rhodanese-like domain-containing protein [Polynucleobacter sp. 30F-ANTBAC]